jgi:predicted amidohydrolase YtcJ
MTGAAPQPSINVRRAEVDGALVDVSCANGVITDVAAHRSGRLGADVDIDADGGALLPGLHDHHIHLLALAAARRSLSVAPPSVTDPAGFDRLLHNVQRDTEEWLRVVGYHESNAGPLDRDRLDSLVPSRPVRVQHASGAMWVLNSAALDAAHLEHAHVEGIERDEFGRATGRLYGLDDFLRDRIPATTLDLVGVGRELAGYGVTGVTDLTPTTNPGEVELLARSVARPDFPLNVTITGALDLPASAAPELPRGPVKLLVADHDLPDVRELARDIHRAHQQGRNVALHCASRIALVIALAAWDEASVMPGDRIEHGAEIPIELLPHLAELELTVVTQPSFVVDRGDRYLQDVPPEERADLWRCGSLVSAGVAVAAGTDAPFGHPDPWRAIAAAAERTTAAGMPLGPAERIAPRHALSLFQTSPHDPAGATRRVAPGQPARLCLLDRPLHEVLRAPTSAAVRATITQDHVTERPM